MRIFIYDKSSSVLSAGISYVINSNFPEAEVIRSGDIFNAATKPDNIDLLILFQEPNTDVDIKQWQSVKEYCYNPPCFGLLDNPDFNNLKKLLCAFPMRLLANGNDLNDELIKAIIENLDNDGIYFSTSITKMLHEYLCNCDDDESHVHLTRRESQILELVRQGKSAPEIAETINLSINTVQVFLSKLRKKFKVNNTLSLINKK